MAASITQFAALNPPTATGQQLDDMFTLAAEQAPIPCAASGTNAISLTQLPNVPTVSAYTNNMEISAVASGTNTGQATAALGTLGALLIFKDTLFGPEPLAASEIVAGCAFTLMFDAALNGGVGGWHLFATTAPSSLISIGGSAFTNFFPGTATLSFPAIAANSSEDLTFSVSAVGPLLIPQVGDFVQIVPPSLAPSGISFEGMVVASVATGATLNVRAVNANSATATPPSGGYRYLAMRTTP